MVRGVGIGVIETDRVARALERHGERFTGRLFTSLERSQCRSRADRVQALSARLAAKEACLKALGVGPGEGVFFAQIEIRREESGRPRLVLLGAADRRADRAGITVLHVSITHQPSAAAALVVLEGRP